MLPFCKLFLGFSKSNPTVITGQSVSAGRPRRNKNATYFIKIVGEFVCNVCGMQFMTKYALYDHNLGVHTEVESLCNGCDKIFRNKTKLANHNRAHIKLRTALIVMSNLVRFNAFIILQRKATRGHTRKECARNPSKTLLSLCMVRVTTELTPSLTWTDTVRSAKL